MRYNSAHDLFRVVPDPAVFLVSGKTPLLRFQHSSCGVGSHSTPRFPVTVRSPMSSHPSPGTARTQLSPLESRAIWLMLGAAFVAILNETTMGVAIPHLIDDLGITAVQAQWLTTAFMLTMAVVIPTTGFLLQRFSTRAMYTATMALFAAGTLLAVVSTSLPLLGRAVII